MLNLIKNNSAILQIGKNQVLERYLEKIQIREKRKVFGVSFSLEFQSRVLRDKILWENIEDHMKSTLTELTLIGKKIDS